MIYVYLFSILAARVVQAVFSKLSSNEANNIVLTVKYTAYQYSVSAALGLILLLADMSNLKIDLPTLGIALLSGVSLFFSTFFSIYGMNGGAACADNRGDLFVRSAREHFAGRGHGDIFRFRMAAYKKFKKYI